MAPRSELNTNRSVLRQSLVLRQVLARDGCISKQHLVRADDAMLQQRLLTILPHMTFALVKSTQNALK